MRKYFVYELKKNAFAIGCLTLISLIVYLTPILSISGSNLIRNGSDLWLSSVIGGVLATLIPVWIFSYKMKQRSVDLYYSLPLSHGSILAVKFLIGLIALFIPYVLSYWLGAFIVISKTSRYTFSQYPFDTFYYLPHFFASLIPVFMMYAISAFMFTRANTVLDGILFVAFWAVVAYFIALVFVEPTMRHVPILTETGYQFQVVYPSCFIYCYPLDFVTWFYQAQMVDKQIYFSTTDAVNIGLGIAYTSLLAAGSTVGLFLLEKRQKAENAEQLSESPFGYRVMIPLYTVVLLSGLTIENELYFYVYFMLTAVGSFMLTALYKRTMKIGIRQTVIIVCSIALGLLVSFLIGLI